MKLRNLVILVLIMGALSSTTLFYFYMTEREFSKNNREFLISINDLENYQSDLTNSLLINSMYTNHNQDEVALFTKSLLDQYEALSNAKILKSENYKSIDKNLAIIKKEIDSNLKYIERYTMFNTGVKNSLIFLSKHIDNAKHIKNEYQSIYVEAVNILKHFNDAKRMKDIDYLGKTELLLKSNISKPEVKDFIKTFNMHAAFLTKSYPQYIEMTKHILNNDIHDVIWDLRNDFSEISMNDFKSFDIFALILFGIFTIALVLIIILFMKYLQENRKLQKTTKSLEHSLIHDQLTNLQNRKAFIDEISLLEFPHLLIVNIDSFKNINDIYGNDTGNELLKSLAQLIKNHLYDSHKSKVYRIGGDEFGIVFDSIDNTKALSIASKLEQSISQHSFVINNQDIHVLVSIASNNVHPILENADLALKLLKKDYTKRVLEYRDSLNLKKSIEDNVNTIKLIKEAIANDRIVPFFQPIINLKTLKIDKYEALVRLKLEDGSFLTPDKFLETSKTTPYYKNITKIMIEKVLKAAQEHPSYRFSVNISMIDILDKEITEMLFEELDANPKIASRLNIELLESENLQDISKVRDFIIRVKKYGVQILLDDFGSGYSNFAYFANLDVDVVKIDGSIVNEITTSKRKLHMLKSIYQFSKGMNLKNIAEFVETQETALLLKEIGIEHAQGYYFGRPLENPLDSDDVTI